MSDKDRNLTPHKPARAAIYLFPDWYEASRLGSMDFWDQLSETDKQQCRYMVESIERAPDEVKQ